MELKLTNEQEITDFLEWRKRKYVNLRYQKDLGIDLSKQPIPRTPTFVKPSVVPNDPIETHDKVHQPIIPPIRGVKRSGKAWTDKERALIHTSVNKTRVEALISNIATVLSRTARSVRDEANRLGYSCKSGYIVSKDRNGRTN